MKRLLSVITILVAVGLVFTACTPTTTTPVATTKPKPTNTTAPKPGPTTAAVPTEFPRAETLYVSGSAWGPPSTWNPFQPGSLANTTGTIGFVYETLFDFNPKTGELTGHLADSGKWTDATTFDVTLRSGLTWSDGKPLTAADVKYTYDLAKTYSALWFSSEWTNVGLKEVAAVDDTHVKFTFTGTPLYQQFANDLYNIPIVPQHLWKDRSEADITTGANNNPVGSGAYLYLSNAEDRNIWQRNENWWGIGVFGKPAPKYIVDIRTSSNNVALGMVLKGELDLSNNFLPGVAELVNKGYVNTFYPKAPYMMSANTAVLFLNTTKMPMNDAKFRKALAFAIDVPGIVGTAYANLVAAASPTALLPSLSKYVDQGTVDSLGYTFDTAKAKQLLADAGYKDTNNDGFVEAPDGAEIKLQVTCPQGWTDWMAAIDIIAASAKQAGINIEAAYPDYGAWNTALQGATFDMTLNNWAGMSNTPWTVYNLLFAHPLKEQMQSGNFGKYDNQAAFDAVDNLAKVSVSDLAAMQAACKEIQTVLLTDMPMIPLWYNGMWAQFSTANWTNWPTDGGSNPGLPTTWSGYWQMGGLTTLINIKPAAAS